MKQIKYILKKLGLFNLVVSLYDWAILRFQTTEMILRIINESNPNQCFLFFPFFHTGGAEKVHLDICKSIANKKPWIIFTNASLDNSLLSEFQETGPIFELSNFIKRSYFLGNILIRVLIWKINKNPASITFGGNCLFYYKLIPQFKSTIFCFDLIHAFVHKGEVGAEYASLPVANRLQKRITINSKTKNDFKWLYAENGLPVELNERVSIIQNKVNVPERYKKKDSLDHLKIGFVSRNSPEKRVNLIGKMAQSLNKKRKANFYLIGPGLEDAIDSDDKKFCEFLGNITIQEELENWYDKIHILVLCSTREGMPMVIMEAMAHSAVCISTNVGGISEHVISGENGYLIDLSNDSKTVEDFVCSIEKLAENPILFEKLSQASFNHAKANFNPRVFDKAWNNQFMNF